MAEEIKPKSNRGGARPGAGRKRKSVDRIAKGNATKERALAVHNAVIQRVSQNGDKVDPVEAIMEVAEWAVDQWRAHRDVASRKEVIEMANCAVEWLAKAAPYVRPRLAAVAVASNEAPATFIQEVRRVIIDAQNA